MDSVAPALPPSSDSLDTSPLASSPHAWVHTLRQGLQAERAAGTRLVTQIVEAVQQHIDSGELRSGTRLPSVRALAQHLGISTFTVAEAYTELVGRQVVAARRGAGYYVQSQRLARRSTQQELKLPARISDDWLTLNMFAQGRELLAAGCGWLPLSWYAENDFHAALRQATRIAGEHLASYGHPLGYAGLRQRGKSGGV